MNATIRERVQSFAEELDALIRKSALEAVKQALGGPAPARAGGAGPRKKARKKGRRKKSASPSPAARAGAPGSTALLDYIRSHPGERLEEIARGMRTTTLALRPAITELLTQRRVRTAGKARGTRYHAGGGGAGRKKAGAKKASKKAGRKKKRRRKKTARPATSPGTAA